MGAGKLLLWRPSRREGEKKAEGGGESSIFQEDRGNAKNAGKLTNRCHR